jgi:branched-chain amino acid transport system ATP-binding protein
LLSVEGIDVYYGGVQALRGVDIAVAEGELVALVGPNGAGKSTLLQSISGLVRPRRGRIVFEGRPIGAVPPQDIVRLGVCQLPEGRGIFARLSVLENLRMGAYVHRADSRGFADAVERVFGYFPRLEERSGQLAGSLSGGEQQMLALGRALVSRPRLLMIDELSLGLAPIIVAKLFEILKQINADGLTVLLIEQYVNLALEASQRAYVINKGRIVSSGRSADLLADRELVRSAYLGHAGQAEVEVTA